MQFSFSNIINRQLFLFVINYITLLTKVYYVGIHIYNIDMMMSIFQSKETTKINIMNWDSTAANNLLRKELEEKYNGA